MGIKLRGVRRTITALQEFDRSLANEAKDLVRKAAGFMVTYAKKRAPFKEGFLEKSIRILSEKETKYKLKIEVVAGQSVETIGDKSRNVVYARYIEEGSYNLGPKSLEKNRRVGPGYKVGPGYISRSYDQVMGYVNREITKRIKRAANKSAAPKPTRRSR